MRVIASPPPPQLHLSLYLYLWYCTATWARPPPPPHPLHGVQLDNRFINYTCKLSMCVTGREYKIRFKKNSCLGRHLNPSILYTWPTQEWNITKANVHILISLANKYLFILIFWIVKRKRDGHVRKRASFLSTRNINHFRVAHFSFCKLPHSEVLHCKPAPFPDPVIIIITVGCVSGCVCTETALLWLVSDLLTAMDNNKICILTLLDL